MCNRNSPMSVASCLPCRRPMEIYGTRSSDWRGRIVHLPQRCYQYVPRDNEYERLPDGFQEICTLSCKWTSKHPCLLSGANEVLHYKKQHHTKVQEYFEEYTAFFNLRPHIRFHQKVLTVTPLPGNKWRVETVSSDGVVSEELFDAVFVCTGHHTLPNVPEWEGVKAFENNGGQLLHSHYYRDPARFIGKKIAVVGVGNSGLSTNVVFFSFLFYAPNTESGLGIQELIYPPSLAALLMRCI